MSQGSSPSVTSAPLEKQDDNLKEVAFLAKDAYIHEPILSTHSVYEDIRIVMENSTTIGHVLNLFNSNLIRVEVPQTYNFPELVRWCVEHYMRDKRAVISCDGKKIIFALALMNMACFLLLTNQG